jgi:hypothetical protein
VHGTEVYEVTGESHLEGNAKETENEHDLKQIGLIRSYKSGDVVPEEYDLKNGLPHDRI